MLLILVYLLNKLEFNKTNMGSSLGFLKFEIFLIALIGSALISVLKYKWYSYVLVAAPVLFFYYFFNEFYIYFNRFPRISDINEIPEMMSVISNLEVIIVLLCSSLYLFLFVWAIDKKRAKRPYLLVLVIVLFFFSMNLRPKTYIALFENLKFEYVSWDLKSTVIKSGYLNFMLYEEASKNYLFNQLSDGLLSEKQALIQPLRTDLEARNIHLIVLESFYDPNMFQNLKFSKNPIHPDFLDSLYLYKNHSLAPVYAGGTPQTEFELLTGAPALAMFGSVEFNFFTGAKIQNSLPNRLRDIGYYTLATNGLTPDIFNSYNAYKGLGFDEQNYLNGKTYLKKKEENLVIFDGDLFDQNLIYIENLIKTKPTTPIFNYIMGMYGHSPFELDPDRHPAIIDVYLEENQLENNRFVRSVNQIYYRTMAISDYINKLSELDPNSIIIVIGDHLPKIDNINKLGYELGNIKRLPFFVVKDSRPQKFDREFHHYDIPNIIIEYLSKENVDAEDDYKRKYMEILSQAIK